MGAVYLGERTEQFRQHVAIKMLHPHVSLSMGEHLLRHEEKVLTSLDHEAIVRLLDTTTHSDGRHCIVMEFVEGLPLDAYCREHATAQEEKLRLLVEIARALDYAHRRLIVHADLKPANILVTAAGRPRILDFGIAILIEPAAYGALGGGALGDGALEATFETRRAAAEHYTPAYASPEQRARLRVTSATDIYSLGMIARNLLTHDDGGGATLQSTRPVTGLGADLSAIVAKATRTEPEQRYTTMQELANDLQAVQDHRPVAARNGDRRYRLGKWIRYRRAVAATLLVLAVVLIASVTGVAVQTARAAHQRKVTQAQLDDLVRLTGTLEGELYDSVHALAGGAGASASLLGGATASLDKLSEAKVEDSSLALEMARQYATLARLQRAQGDTAEAGRDVDKSLGLLRSISTNDRNHSAAATEMQNLAVQ
jgi:tRNA A-37 threonylcarbamoyl transferase component Bud32